MVGCRAASDAAEFESVVGSSRVARVSCAVRVGRVIIGGGSPVVVQSMALGGSGSLSSDLEEILCLAREGSELIRVAINSEESIKSIPRIVEHLVSHGFDEKMVVGCGQYEVADLLNKYPDDAAFLGKIRINPGNVGFGDKRDRNFESVIEYAIKHDIPVRIGVNWGSLDKALIGKLMDDNASLASPYPDNVVMRKALVTSALQSAELAERIGLPRNKIVLSCKTSKVRDLVAVYSALSESADYALHLGLTEAGTGLKGIVSSTAGIAHLLLMGIGDTIRVSLTSTSREDRAQEVRVCKEILQSLGLRFFSAQTTSCPGCGRTNFPYFQKLVSGVNNYIDRRMQVWKVSNPGVVNMTVAVMGCVVNGPGESKHANLGISLPGNGEREVAAVYEDGRKLCTLHGENVLGEFLEIVESYVHRKYG
ncbi:flavodoxin-dependent (E)-4-hydroxy-3-methylbut-2-enyl-diphosphate synthase [Anaplasma marginale]|uniref:flavodoxin-dependent (E)-4-hydroxy-3-methylbut-2-enyl-diphosphate synthase n=1 Tax=Anaplasma marginale TaxID=770 RepID=UPI000E5970A8|nr:flavodoxin-dependent (E)-4-hydroxy-3-methylbut-2-enyl-diphosphate synthase [Anaplasma marginale]AXW84124.1 4-hydroxy-3-methylbut-2-en-1-yl diphosphate synthase [Anaplasma marginale]KAB0451681.1 flavodoxin-dependent (E)-4-hydroxy-3-methylbut-2-enyl-diphosphate synthase [Anaplasma marginale]